MKIIKAKYFSEIPFNFTGIVKIIDFNNVGYISTTYRVNGNLHRLDGPAVIYENNENCYDGINPKYYWINGKCISHNDEQKFYNSKEYKQAILLENMKRIKGIT